MHHVVYHSTASPGRLSIPNQCQSPERSGDDYRDHGIYECHLRGGRETAEAGGF